MIKILQNSYKLDKMADAHMEGEEKFFYPQLMEKDRKLALESYEEYYVGKIVLNELNNMDEKEAWILKVKVLKVILDHHIDEVLNQIFPKSKRLLIADNNTKYLNGLTGQIINDHAAYGKNSRN